MACDNLSHSQIGKHRNMEMKEHFGIWHQWYKNGRILPSCEKVATQFWRAACSE